MHICNLAYVYGILHCEICTCKLNLLLYAHFCIFLFFTFKMPFEMKKYPFVHLSPCDPQLVPAALDKASGVLNF